MNQGFIPPHGGYEGLHSYKKSLIIFMATYYLAEKWVRIGSRTRDQMEQSARSGKQNILEGSLASATSKKTEIHLTNVARASIGELHEDYKDFSCVCAGLPALRQAHAAAQSPSGCQCRQAILGLHQLPRLPQNQKDWRLMLTAGVKA